MKAMNLYLLTRADGEEAFSLLARELTGEVRHRKYSRHEVKSLRALVDHISGALRARAESGRSWVSYLDGFYFSYTIAHISKEFDLLKISGDGECILNIELKSEDIDQERIAKQLAQNRYYLSHISKSIYSFTYVMQTNTLYMYNDKGYLRTCKAGELAKILQRPAFQSYVDKDLDLYFRATDYLIAPAAMPEKFLQGNYFLTNQQAEFRRRILADLKEAESRQERIVITVTGSAGTGKTLLLFDLAMALSKRKKVILLIAGKMQAGHKIINERLRNVRICPAEEFDPRQECAYLLVDEANRVSETVMDRIIHAMTVHKTPCLMAYDPQQLLVPEEEMAKRQERIEDLSGDLDDCIALTNSASGLTDAAGNLMEVSGGFMDSTHDVFASNDKLLQNLETELSKIKKTDTSKLEAAVEHGSHARCCRGVEKPQSFDCRQTFAVHKPLGARFGSEAGERLVYHHPFKRFRLAELAHQSLLVYCHRAPRQSGCIAQRKRSFCLVKDAIRLLCHRALRDYRHKYGKY